jgi:uncharacterized protein YdeI (YjbR/CyaY-like superfamily)
VKEILFRDRSVWRRWLERNHAASGGIWMVYLKGRKAGECIAYEDAIEEALCWGWIDSIIKKVDPEKYVRRFTPRRPGSIWSRLNKRRIAKMVKAGRMTKAGLARIDAAKQNGDWEKAASPFAGLDELPDFQKALTANKNAKKFFEGLAPSYKRQFLGWIGNARQDDTRTRRISEAISLLARHERLA